MFTPFPSATSRPPWARIPEKDRLLSTTSALVWLPPLIEDGTIRIPRTEVVRVVPASLWCAIGEGDEVPEKVPWDELRAAADRIGYPCFVRTDLSSAKHDGPTSYRLDSPESLTRVVLDTFSDNAEKDLAAGPTPLRAFLFREWLDLDAPFTAFGRIGVPGSPGHPIAREWRIFVDERSGVRCHHFYWPEDALDGYVAPSAPDWRSIRQALADDTSDIPQLRQIAARAVELVNASIRSNPVGISMPAYARTGWLPALNWSVDFARTRDGVWYLIDMAEAAASWHPSCIPETP